MIRSERTTLASSAPIGNRLFLPVANAFAEGDVLLSGGQEKLDGQQETADESQAGDNDVGPLGIAERGGKTGAACADDEVDQQQCQINYAVKNEGHRGGDPV